jgi:hypothetical protein
MRDALSMCRRYPIISPSTFSSAKETGMATIVQIIEFSDYL